MDVYVNLLFVCSCLCSFGISFGYFQWNVIPNAVVCSGDDAQLSWDYTTNETTSIIIWEKIGSQNGIFARIFLGSFNTFGSYTDRVNRTNNGKAAIVIRSVTTNDSGTYGCTIQSSYSENISLIVAAPSGMPYFSKTNNSLSCNLPQNSGTPSVVTTMKLQDGTVNPSLTTTQSGAYECCINGDAVRCLSSTSNSATEVCVNGTLEGSDNGGGLSTAEIVGIVIAVVIIVCGVAVFVIYIIFFKNKSRDGKDSEKKKLKGRKSSTVGTIDTPEKKNGNWFKPNCFSVDVTQTGGRDGSVTSRRDVVVDLQDTKTLKGVNSEKSDTPRKLPPLPSIISVTNDQLQEEKPKKKKKKKKRAKQEQNQQGKDNTAFDNDQTENVPSDDIGNPETNTTPSNKENVLSDEQGNLETTTPSNNHNILSGDIGNLETTTPRDNHNIPSDDPTNMETT